MARGPRTDIGDLVYHVINRANGRFVIFENDRRYLDFEALLSQAKERYDMRILAYVLMPNHWHLLLYPRNNNDLSRCMQWLGNAHTRRFHVQTKTIGMGHLYQGRYKSFLVDTDQHLLTVLKYIERNPVRAGLSEKVEDWKWGSAYRRAYVKDDHLLDEPPALLPQHYLNWLNEPEPSEEMKAVRHSVVRGVPYGRESWREQMIAEYHLEYTARSVGRPKKNGD